LGLKQSDLAKSAKVALKTLADFERGATVPHDRTVRDIQKALEEIGIEFLFDGAEGIGLRKRRSGSPPSTS
jgi:predicted transcriptional regulator